MEITIALQDEFSFIASSSQLQSLSGSPLFTAPPSSSSGGTTILYPACLMVSAVYISVIGLLSIGIKIMQSLKTLGCAAPAAADSINTANIKIKDIVRIITRPSKSILFFYTSMLPEKILPAA